MKSFTADMLGDAEDSIVVNITGPGVVKIDLAPVDTQNVLDARRSMAESMGDMDDGASNAEAVALMSGFAIQLVGWSVSETLSEAECVKLIVATGGFNSDFIKSLAQRMGVYDIMFGGGGEDDPSQLPT